MSSGEDARSATRQRAGLTVDIHEALEAILRSTPFHSSRQTQALLRYLVEHSLNNQEGMLKERVIGAEVFGRKPDYNTGDDPIVRARVGELRKRLAQYYQSEDAQGANLQIVIPPGTYAAQFQLRSQERVVLPSPVSHETTDEDQSGNAAPELATGAAKIPANKRRTWLRNLWIGAACVAAFVLGLVADAHFRSSGSASATRATVRNPLIGRIFGHNEVVNVVLGDVGLVTLLDTLPGDISAGDYLQPNYADKIVARSSDSVLRSALLRMNGHRYTTLFDADVAAQCSHWGTVLDTKTYIRFARYMHVRDFQNGNFVVVGNRRFNPWTALFEAKLNFVMEEDPATHIFHVRNRNPKPGEQPTYELKHEGAENTGYVDVAVLPNLAGTGTVLLLNGLWSEMNTAAVDMFLGRDLPASLSGIVSSQPEGSTIEVLIRVHDLDSAQASTEIVSIRSHSN
jgi:hypothetical protein